MAYLEPKFERVAKDCRGESWRIVFPDNREVLLMFTKAGFFRGGHAHNVPEMSFLLTGRLKYWKIVDGKETIFERTVGETTFNNPGEVHLALALEDCYIMEWKINKRIGEWVTTDYEPYRIKVTSQLKDVRIH